MCAAKLAMLSFYTAFNKCYSTLAGSHGNILWQWLVGKGVTGRVDKSLCGKWTCEVKAQQKEFGFSQYNSLMDQLFIDCGHLENLDCLIAYRRNTCTQFINSSAFIQWW